MAENHKKADADGADRFRLLKLYQGTLMNVIEKTGGSLFFIV